MYCTPKHSVRFVSSLTELTLSVEWDCNCIQRLDKLNWPDWTAPDISLFSLFKGMLLYHYVMTWFLCVSPQSFRKHNLMFHKLFEDIPETETLTASEWKWSWRCFPRHERRINMTVGLCSLGLHFKRGPCFVMSCLFCADITLSLIIVVVFFISALHLFCSFPVLVFWVCGLSGGNGSFSQCFIWFTVLFSLILVRDSVCRVVGAGMCACVGAWGGSSALLLYIRCDVKRLWLTSKKALYKSYQLLILEYRHFMTSTE